MRIRNSICLLLTLLMITTLIISPALANSDVEAAEAMQMQENADEAEEVNAEDVQIEQESPEETAIWNDEPVAELAVDINEFELLALDGASGDNYNFYECDEYDNIIVSTEKKGNWEDIPCGAGYIHVLADGTTDESGVKEHDYQIVSYQYTADNQTKTVADYDDIPCECYYTVICICSGSNCPEPDLRYNWYKEHVMPESGFVSTEDNVSCGETYTISYTCTNPNCETSVVDEYVKGHDYADLYVTEAGTYSDYEDIPCGAEYTDTRTCRICGDTKSEEAKIREHTPGDDVSYYDLNNNEIDPGTLTCGQSYTEKYTCANAECAKQVEAKCEVDHEIDIAKDILYAACTVKLDDQNNRVVDEITGGYVESLEEIDQCEVWYAEKFTCAKCLNEIVTLAAYKEHQWETNDGKEICSVCNKAKLKSANIDNRTNSNSKAEVSITDAVEGKFTVTCDLACIVAYSDHGEYVQLKGTATGSRTYAFELPEDAMTGDLAVVVFIKGDVSGDGKINAKDASLINKHILLGPKHVELESVFAEFVADVDHNGKINARDVSFINKQILKGTKHEDMDWQ